MYIGQTGSFTALHSDTCDTSIVQVRGMKRVVLFPPSTSLADLEAIWRDENIAQGSLSRPGLHFFFPVDIGEADATKIALANGRVVLLQAGETLYIPHGW